MGSKAQSRGLAPICCMHDPGASTARAPTVPMGSVWALAELQPPPFEFSQAELRWPKTGVLPAWIKTQLSRRGVFSEESALRHSRQVCPPAFS